MFQCPRLTFAGLALAGLLPACAAVPPVAEPPALEGTGWILAALPERALLPGSRVTLGFEAGRASGSDGCNRYALPYSASGAKLSVEPGGIATQMACAPEVMQQAQAFLSSLGATRSYRLATGQLQLLGADGAVLATLVPQPQGVAGTTWRVTAYNNGRQAVVSVLGGTTLTVAFSADGKASGSSGCNNFVGPYASTGSSLSIGPTASTRMICAEPPGIMEQEQQFQRALATVATARREGDRLELRTADGALAVSLARDDTE